MVFVVSKNGQPLMPTGNHRMVRLLLKAGKASVLERTPFTIKLRGNVHNFCQPVTLGVDAGSVHIGLSASTERKELYSAEVEVRDDINRKLKQKRTLRRSRRNRTTRHRSPRFKNRKRPNKWLAPSAEAKTNLHIRLAHDIQSILPVTKIVIETAPFDIHKIQNPDVEGVGYQQGPQYGWENVRQYVLWRDGMKCCGCEGRSGDRNLEVHHIKQRKDGGSDRPGNLITLCHTCHQAVHDKKIVLDAKPGMELRHAAFMGLVRRHVADRLRKEFPETHITYGHITKVDREEHGIPKSHRNDAFAIAGNFEAGRSDNWYAEKKARCHNRQLHRLAIGKGGIRRSNQCPRRTFGFQLFDKVLCQGQEGFVFARRKSGSFDVRRLDGTRISANISHKKLTLLRMRQTILTEKEACAASSPCLKTGAWAARM